MAGCEVIIPANTEQWVAIVAKDVRPKEVEDFKPLVVIAWDVPDVGGDVPVAITREGHTFHERDELLVFGNKYQAVREQIVRLAERNAK
jgi:hypothetical protein